MQRPISVGGLARGRLAGKRTSKGHSARKWREALTAYVFIAPYILIITVFLVITTLTAFGFSFFYVDFGFTQPVFVGFHNYRIIWYDFTHQGAFITSIINIFKYTIGVVTLQTIVALALALLVNQKVRGMSWFRTAFYLPSLTSSVAISIIFLWLYNQQGAINYLLSLIHIPAHPWLNDPNTALPAIMLLVIWTTAPSMMLIYLAGLQDIPETLYEAARIDGANGWQLIRYITVPLLRPTTFLVVALGTIGAFQAFDQVYIMQGPNGGPLMSTLTPVLEIYNLAFGGNGLMGQACAEAFVLFVIVFAFTYLERRFIDADVQY